MESLKLLIIKKWWLTGTIFFSIISTGFNQTKTLIDYFLPMPVVKTLRTDKWGCASTGKRDISNGLEDTTNRAYSYWDGPIIKGPDGKFHMFASRWGQSGGHWAWLSSVGVHAVSESVMGPYVDKGMIWPSDQNGKGHNLTILQLKDGTYASVVSDTRPGDFFIAPSLDGPWKFAGAIRINANGYNKPSHIANLSMIIRPDDGRYMIVERGGQIMISNKELTGPYLIQGNSVYKSVNLPNLEDPVLWHSGGYYHIVVNSWSEKKAFHLRSKDGINKWTNQGIAFDPRSKFLRYTDGTVNHWTKIERPGVYIENGHVTHWTFAVIDAEKESDQGNDNHNSKVIVVPFDGSGFDGEIKTASLSDGYKKSDPVCMFENGFLQIRFNQEPETGASVEVYNLMGITVYSGHLKNNREKHLVNLSRLPNGMYAVALKSKGNVTGIKFLHQK